MISRLFRRSRTRPVQRNTSLRNPESLETRLLLAGDFIPGDANRDYYFDESDFILAFKSGTYLRDIPARWEDGDWNGDDRFDSVDFVAAFTTGQYLKGAYDDDAGAPVHDRRRFTIDRGEATDAVVTYDSATGDVFLRANSPLTTFEIYSESERFLSTPSPQLEDLFDIQREYSRFRLEPSGFTEIDFPQLLPPGLDYSSLLEDLTYDGSLLIGGPIFATIYCEGCSQRTFVNPRASGAVVEPSIEIDVKPGQTNAQVNVDVEAGDRSTFVISSSESVSADLRVLDSNDQTVASGSLADGKPLVLNSIDTTSGGRFRLELSFSDDVMGTVHVQRLSNATLEWEDVSQTPNSAPDSAQPMDSLFVPAPFDVQVSTILGDVDLTDSISTTIASEAFVSEQPGENWNFHSLGNGHISISNSQPAGEGQFALLMDATPLDPIDERPGITLYYNPIDGSLRIMNSLDSQMVTLEIISKSHIFTGDPAPREIFDGLFDIDSDNKLFILEPSGMPNAIDLPRIAQPGLTVDFLMDDLTIAGSLNVGGALPDVTIAFDVAESVNEAIWEIDALGNSRLMLSFLHSEWNDTELELPSSFQGTAIGDGVSVSIDGSTWYRVFTPTDQPTGVWERHTVPISATLFGTDSIDGPLKIKFQQTGNDRLPNSGRGYDDIQVVKRVDHDWYSLTPSINEIVSFVAAGNEDGVSVAVELFDSTGKSLAQESTSTDSLAVINNFRSDGTPISAHVVADGKYALTTIRNGQFEPEPFSNGIKPLSPTGNTLGYSSGEIDRYGYGTTSTIARAANFRGESVNVETNPAGFEGARASLTTVSIGSSQQSGPYVLNMPSEVPAELFFITDPSANESTTQANSIVLDSLFPFDTTTVQVEDVTIDGLPAVRFDVEQPNRIRFEFTPLADGEHIIHVPPNAVRDLAGNGNSELSTTYEIDTQPPTVVSTSITENAVVPAGPVSVAIELNEAVSFGSDFAFSLTAAGNGQSFPPVNVDIDDTKRILSLQYDLQREDSYLLLIPATAIVDEAELPMAEDFRLHFDTDIETLPISESRTPLTPLGSSAYDIGRQNGILSPHDTDRFTVSVDEGQVITALAETALLRPAITVIAPNGDVLASNENTSDYFVSALATTTGEYTIDYSNMTDDASPFVARIYLNRLMETSRTNQLLDTAQSIDTFMEYGRNNARQISLQGQLSPFTSETFTSESFEQGTLPASWSTTGSDLNARVRVSNEFGASDGQYALMMDTGPEGQFARRPAVLLVYDPTTGELAIDTHRSLTTIEITSASGIFTGEPAQNIQPPWDVDIDTKIFKFGPDGFDSLSFGNVAATGLTYEFLATDLTIRGTFERRDDEPAGSFEIDSDIIVVEDGVRAEAIWTVDLSGLDKPVLHFSHITRNDAPTHLPISYVGTAPGDGVSISIDQQQWYRVFTPRDQVTNDWTNESVSLSDVAEFAEIDLNRPVFFKFQHYGNGTLPDAGRGFDDIRIASAQRDTDWYSITLADGESLAARLDTAAVADITLEIHDTNGMIVQSNRIGDSVELQPFVDKTNNGIPDQYFLHVDQMGELAFDYQLTTSINAGWRGGVSTQHAIDVFDLTVPKAYSGFLGPESSQSYQLELDAGVAVRIMTETPRADGHAGKNDLFPAIQLIDPDGAVVATDSGSIDGRDSEISWVTTAAGTYRVVITAIDDTSGEYLVTVEGDIAEPRFEAIDVTPKPGQLRMTSPHEFSVVLNHLIDVNTVNAEDLLVNGQPIASAVDIIDGRMLRFQLPREQDGTSFDYQIPAGAFTSIYGDAVSVINSSVTVDTISPAIVRTSFDDADLIAGHHVIDIFFSEPIDPTTIDSNEIRLLAFDGPITPESVFLNPEGTKLSVDFGALLEGEYRLTVSRRAFRDRAGNFPLTPYAKQVIVQDAADDVSDLFAPVLPLESFAFESPPLEGTFAFSGDKDTFTFDLPANQLISVYTADPQGRHRVELLDPTGRRIAWNENASQQSQLVAVGQSAGTYQFIVEDLGGPLRAYTTRISLNQIWEPTRKQTTIDRFFRGTTVPKTTIHGTIRRGQDVYPITVDEGEYLSIGLSSPDSQLTLELLDEFNQVVAVGTSGFGFQSAISEKLDQSVDGLPSLYHIRVASDSFQISDYTLSIFRDAGLEGNQDATEIGPSLRMVGAVDKPNDRDSYRFYASGGDFTVTIATPHEELLSAPLETQLVLFDPTGQQLTSQESVLTFNAAPGMYRVDVVGVNGIGGYIVDFKGAVGPNALTVNSIAPSNQTLYGIPQTVVVDFNHAIDPSSVSPNVLQIGTKHAVAVEALSATRFVFALSPDADQGDGNYLLRIDEASVSSLNGLNSEAFETEFQVDRSSADFNDDGQIDADDLNAFCREHATLTSIFDINRDGIFDQLDLVRILQDTFNATPGDITLDGRFDSQDLVRMFAAAKYESGAADANWTDGDFNCDGQVTTADLVFAFRFGSYARNAAALPFARSISEIARPDLQPSKHQHRLGPHRPVMVPSEVQLEPPVAIAERIPNDVRRPERRMMISKVDRAIRNFSDEDFCTDPILWYDVD